MRTSGRLRGAAWPAGAVIVLMLLTGCQADGDPSANETQSQPSSTSAPTTAEASESATASPSPEPSPASSAGPAANIPVPVKPALADENSKEGLEAFTKYWLELFSYGYQTNDWAPFEAVTDVGCTTCENLKAEVNRVYDDGGWIAGGQIRLNSFNTEFIANTVGSINSYVDVQQSGLVYFGQGGAQKGTSEEYPSTINVTIALWKQGRWIMLDFGSPEGT
ncbi:DUF6318 family protein [Arthrobacter sedimenti]|uniref:DUF6318 family protein n=1 Tax=Arthrobacter sedimenti TaxID=2694931 RepID=UPI002D7E3BCC|nr:DUF6318 family protein [Arthrobacter sedimenti]